MYGSTLVLGPMEVPVHQGTGKSKPQHSTTSNVKQQAAHTYTMHTR